MAKRIKPSKALAQLGIELPEVSAPIAQYVPATWGADTIKGAGSGSVWTSGQLPMREGNLIGSGKVGEGDFLVSPEYARECAAQCALNALAAAAAVAGGVDNLDGVIKLTGFVASHPSFTAQAGVIDGASEFFAQIFPELPKNIEKNPFGPGHARSAVGVSVLPLDAPVEIEVVFAARR